MTRTVCGGAVRAGGEEGLESGREGPTECLVVDGVVVEAQFGGVDVSCDGKGSAVSDG